MDEYRSRFFKLHNPLYYLLFILNLIIGCQNVSGPDFEYLFKEYSKNKKDSLKLQSLIFIRENISDMTSEKVFFLNEEGQKVDIRLDTIASDSSLKDILLKNNLTYSSEFTIDLQNLSTSQLDENISRAIESWNKYPWSKDVPKTIFLNYLLPYKVFGEETENWRNYFVNKYKDSIMSYQKRRISDANIVYSLAINDMYKWVMYSENFTRLTQYPSLKELLAVKKGECYNLSQLIVYINRAYGIPATIDLVPLWGKVSGSHATNVFYREIKDIDGESKFGFRPAVGNELIQPPKVFRTSFKKTNLWTDSIKPILKGGNYYVPEFLKTNHHFDVTNEYVKTITLNYPISFEQSLPIAYICVYNYGQWKPIFYGKKSSIYKRFTFNKMAVDMAYQIAIPNKGSFKLIDRPFIVDSIGNIVHSEPQSNVKRTLDVPKTNKGDASWVKANNKYTLMILNNNGDWKEFATKKCQKDSILRFEEVPQGAFYMLKNRSSGKNLERIFLYRNSQIWY